VKKGLSLVLSALAVCVAPANADKGSIPFHPHVRIFEPTQRAMIAWNGEEEILVLSTDLHASESTKVLEVMPLPNEPQVVKGDVEVFRKAIRLINEKIGTYVAPSKSAKSGGGYHTSPAGEGTFHEKIGAHDISVTKVLDRDGFIEWVNDYLKKAGVDNPQIPEIMQSTVAEYLGEGFAWFTFDVVSLDEVPKTNDAIQYRFNTDQLFYPLKISRTDHGETSIELLILTPRLFSTFPGISSDRVELRHKPIGITSDELSSLNPDMAALLHHRDDMKLRIWRIKGNLESFDKDLIAR
jgi:hypothetical protein